MNQLERMKERMRKREIARERGHLAPFPVRKRKEIGAPQHVIDEINRTMKKGDAHILALIAAGATHKQIAPLYGYSSTSSMASRVCDIYRRRRLSTGE